MVIRLSRTSTSFVLMLTAFGTVYGIMPRMARAGDAASVTKAKIVSSSALTIKPCCVRMGG